MLHVSFRHVRCILAIEFESGPKMALHEAQQSEKCRVVRARIRRSTPFTTFASLATFTTLAALGDEVTCLRHIRVAAGATGLVGVCQGY